MTTVLATFSVTVAIAGFLLVAALLVGSIGSSENINREPLTIVTANGTTARLQVEIVRTAEERALGFMNRIELPLDTGMLFVIEPPGRGFWMKDTPLSLTVAFVAECGEIVDFADLEPFSEEIKNTDRDYSFGLEVDQGWFERNGISLGDLVSLPKYLRSSDCK